jgi:hypothetical protein
MDDQERAIVDKLILDGAMEIAGIDSNNGEFLYVFTPKLKEVMPELYHEHVNHVNGELMRLWEMGFINIDFMSDSPIVTLAEKALDKAELDKLSKQDLWSIQEIKRLLTAKEL